jgi:acyl-CoA thioesterase FadM
MARIKIILPEKFNYSTTIDVRITDINYGGHLGNDSVLGIIHEARVRLLKQNGFSEGDIGGVGILMMDAVINYSAEGFYGDELRIDVAVAEITNAGCDIYYRFVNVANDKIIVKAKTNIAFYNYTTRKVTRTPQIFTNTFQ